MARRDKKRRLWHRSPYDGVPGFRAMVLRFLYQIEGPSQLGDRNEPAYIPDPDPSCPVCKQSMKLHRVERGGPGERTHLKCPRPVTEAAADAV